MLVNCEMEGSPPSLIHNIEVEHRTSIGFVDLDNVSYYLVLALSDGNMDGSCLFLINMVDVNLLADTFS